jgi:hypothetical protein
MAKYIINYSRTGLACPDYWFDNDDYWFQSHIVAFDGDPIHVSTQNAIDRIRLAITRGEIAAADVEIQFEGQSLTLSKTGRIYPWPNGFCDTNSRLSEEILRSVFNIL